MALPSSHDLAISNAGDSLTDAEALCPGCHPSDAPGKLLLRSSTPWHALSRKAHTEDGASVVWAGCPRCHPEDSLAHHSDTPAPWHPGGRAACACKTNLLG